MIRLALLGMAAVMVARGDQRWSFVGIVLAANIDVPSAGIGVVNAAKHIVLPVLYAWRAGYRPGDVMRTRTLGILFAGLLLAFAMNAARYEPLAGSEMVVYLLAAWLVAMGVMHADLQSSLDGATLRFAIWASLACALVQETLEHNDAAHQEARLTSFVNPQQFAVLIVVLGALLWRAHLLHPENANRLTAAVMGAAVVGSGSRSAVIGTIAGIAVGAIWRANVRPTMALGTVSGLVFAFTALLILIWSGATSNVRAFQAINALHQPKQVGTLDYRLDVYDTAVREIKQRDAVTLLVGSGVGSAREVFRDTAVYRDQIAMVDPNRTMHNEWLRTLFELGLVGFGIFVALVAQVVVETISLARGPNGVQAVATLVGLPVLLMFMTSENVLSGGLAGAGAAYSLLLGAMMAARATLPRDGADNARI